MNDYELIWDFLHVFFNYEFYASAIEDARQAITADPFYKKNWSQIIAATGLSPKS